MVHVFLPRRWRSPRVWLGMLGCSTVFLLAWAPPPAPAQGTSKKTGPGRSGAPNQAQSKGAAPAAKAKGEAAKVAPVPAPDSANPLPADSSQTQRVAPNEIFKDPIAEQALDVNKFPAITSPPPPVTADEIMAVKGMASNPNEIPDRAKIERVVQSLAAELTDHRNLQALIDPSPGKTNPAVAQAIQNATTNLLEPLFLAQSAKNQAFLAIYQRALIQKLFPLLKKHLISRVQAMIILGECGSPEALNIYENEIKDGKQTLWVKLWALEGIRNIKQRGGRLTADAESRAGKLIADFLNTENLPWPVQLRALEALGALRQGFLPAQPRPAHMANTAMRFLVDPEAKLEVRAEAARALGLMQITPAVPKYNYALIAHAAGQLAADLGAEIDSTFSAKPPRAENLTKARYLAALLIGPVYQAFDGVPGLNDSGLPHAFANPATDYVQKVRDRVKPVAQTVVQLLGAPSKQIPELKSTLGKAIAALRDFLAKNPPPDRRLVPGGQEFAEPAAGAWFAAPAHPVAGLSRGR
jgi:hypothetical protein